MRTDKLVIYESETSHLPVITLMRFILLNLWPTSLVTLDKLKHTGHLFPILTGVLHVVLPIDFQSGHFLV